MLRVMMPASTLPTIKFKLTCNEYGYTLDNSKHKVFKDLRKVMLQDLINSYLPSCDYSLIMKSLMPSPAEFADFEGFLSISDDIHDANDIISYSSILQEQFVNLPLEVKQHYDNNYELFAHDVVSGGFADFVTEKYKPKQGSEISSGDTASGGSGNQRTEPGYDDRISELVNRVDDLAKKLGGEVNE